MFKLFFWVNTIVFLLYTSVAAWVLVKMRFSLDRVSIWSILAVFFSFLVRFTNWFIFKLQNWGIGDGKDLDFSHYFILVDASATTVFLLNAYYFGFEIKMVHE